MLIYSSLSAGCEINFIKTKRSVYAPKVLRGRETRWSEQGESDYLASFIKVSTTFCEKMKRLIENSRTRGEKSVDVTNDMIQDIVIDQDPVLFKGIRDLDSITEDSKEIDGRTRESAFTNYMAYNLIKRGFTLTTKTCALKKAREMHFYVWEKVIFPNGTVVHIDNGDFFTNVIEGIEETLKTTPYFVLKKSTLDVILNAYQSNSLASAFKPVNSNMYSVYSSEK